MSIDHVVLLISHWLMHVPSFDCFLPIVNFLCIILYASEFAPKCNQNAPLTGCMLYQPVHDLLIFTLWIRYDVRENNL